VAFSTGRTARVKAEEGEEDEAEEAIFGPASTIKLIGRRCEEGEELKL
jgi:hypothetical protein